MASNITPVPPDKIGETHAWREWFFRIYLLLNGTAAGTVPINHNALSSIQGGNGSTEEYHLTAAQHTVVGNTSGTNTGDQTLAGLGGITIAIARQVATLRA